MRRCIGGIVTALISIAVAALAEQATTVTPQQIEADWMSPEALRQVSGTITVASDKPTPEQDAAGGCDGVKNGQYGFHTALEDKAWWQVDLGEPAALDRLVLYNRCNTGAHNSRLIVLLSQDGRTFSRAYQHDGTVFGGFTDQKPLVIALNGATARYVRLQQPDKRYLYLDEVEVNPAGSRRNIALGKAATQSSTSRWSVVHGTAPQESSARTAAKAVERGLQLADNLRAAGVEVGEDVKILQQIRAKLAGLSSDGSDASRQPLYLEARRTVRNLALRNPLLDFDSILFVKSAPGRFPHMSDQFYGWWSRPGGGVFILEGFKGPAPRLLCLTADMAEGSFLRPDLSYDGTRVLFAYCKYYSHVPDIRNKTDKTNLPEDAFYHVFEMNLDGSGRRQLTRGRYDDFDARYLPNGDIVFLSTRKGQFLQCTKANTARTLREDLPDSYVRCGGDDYRPVPVFTLHAMDSRGENLRPISAFENFEWTPAVANDGRILYTRWDYIDRFNGPFFSLWVANANGANPQLVYGNYTVRPQVVCDARPIPNSHKLVFTASAHHSIVGGSLVLFDRSRGTEEDGPIKRLTPEVPFPETESNVNTYYANAFPLSEEHYLVGWSNRKLPPHSRVDGSDQNPVNAMGLYLYDAFGNLNLLYRDPTISSAGPIPVRPRLRPPIQPDTIAWDDGEAEGSFLVQDVYEGLAGVTRGAVKWLRVVGVPPKVQPRMNEPTLGVSREDPGKFLLGAAPVEADGSAHFRVPSGVPVFFQALDADGVALQTMRSLTYVWPGQTLSCVGCHESREAAPTIPGKTPLAASRAPSRLVPGPDGAWPLRFDQLVQPVLDKWCVSCHRPGSGDEKAARLDLTAAKSYDNLLSFGDKDLQHLVFERDRSIVGETPARKSKLLALLRKDGGHEGVRLDAESLNRLVVWMDLYAQRQGSFSVEQENELRDLRRKLAPLLAVNEPRPGPAQ